MGNGFETIPLRASYVTNILKVSGLIPFAHAQAQLKLIGVRLKAVRLKKYGKKRILIAHEKEDLSDTPRFLITSAIHCSVHRILNLWKVQRSSEIFHEFSKQNCGFESAQHCSEEAVKRHFRLRGKAQTMKAKLGFACFAISKI